MSWVVIFVELELILWFVFVASQKEGKEEGGIGPTQG